MSDRRRTALLKPFQLLGIAAGLGLFAGAIVMLTIRRLDLALIGAGAIFIVATVVLAMLVLSYQPNPDVPVYLDRFEGRDGEEAHQLRVDADAALDDGRAAPREEPRRRDEDDDAPSAP